MSEENKTPQAATPPQGQVSAELTVQDLSVLKTIIEVAQSRGAFKANELEAVGKTYNKLNAFLEHVSKQAQANQEQQGEK